MIKKGIALVLAITLVFSMTACGNLPQPYDDIDLSEYVTLGDYLGVEIEKIEPQEITDEILQQEIQARLSQNTTQEEVKEGVVEEGDTLNIDYEGKVDGKSTDGTTAQGAELIIGSGMFIDGFESGLVGKKIGETVVLDLTFPEEYENNPDLAGKPVVFTVKINSKKVDVVPELNDEYVKSVSDCKTVKEYEKQVKKELEEMAASAAEQQMMGAVWQKVFEASKVNKYPDEMVAEKIAELKTSYEQYAQSYGMTFEDFIAMAQMTPESFDEQAKQAAEATVADEMLIYAIAKELNITLSEKDYKEGAQEFVESMGFEDLETLEKTYTKEVIANALMQQKVFEFLLQKAKIVEPAKDDAAKDDNTKDAE